MLACVASVRRARQGVIEVSEVRPPRGVCRLALGAMVKPLLLLALAPSGALAQMFGNLPMAPPRDSCP